MPSGELFNAFLDIFADYTPWVILGTARPFGFTLLFAIFAWTQVGTGMLRMVFAIGITLPLLANGVPSAEIVFEMNFMALLAKELLIGAVLGFASSVPLAIAIAGGGIIDIYRGAFLGNADPSGGEVTAYGNLFAVLTLWLFASIGGFQIVTGTIYTSYDIWAVNTTFPSFVPGADMLLEILEHILLNAVVLAGPLLVIMFLSDIIHLIGAKFGKNIDVGHLTFSTKNLIAMMILPLFLVMSIRLFKDNLGFLATVPELVQGIIR